MQKRIQQILQSSLSIHQLIEQDQQMHQQLEQIASLMINCLKEGGKVLFCGNGGSAADAQHLSTELAARFYHERQALYAEALHVNTSFLTAVGNDYNYERVFSRALESKGRKGDILYALSTSGNSPNILAAIKTASELQMSIVGMTGSSGGKMLDLCDELVRVPSDDTPRIQEAHILLGHVICELVEQAFV